MVLERENSTQFNFRNVSQIVFSNITDYSSCVEIFALDFRRYLKTVINLNFHRLVLIYVFLFCTRVYLHRIKTIKRFQLVYSLFKSKWPLFQPYQHAKGFKACNYPLNSEQYCVKFAVNALQFKCTSMLSLCTGSKTNPFFITVFLHFPHWFDISYLLCVGNHWQSPALFPNTAQLYKRLMISIWKSPRGKLLGGVFVMNETPPACTDLGVAECTKRSHLLPGGYQCVCFCCFVFQNVSLSSVLQI